MWTGTDVPASSVDDASHMNSTDGLHNLEPHQDRFRVLIAGGGVAGFEAAFALRAIDPAAFDVTLLTPDEDMRYRPHSVREPFGHKGAARFPVEAIAADAGANVVHGALTSVVPEENRVNTSEGGTLSYDALIIAAGARSYPGLPHATTIDDAHIDDLLHGVVQDVEDGYVSRLAFVQSANGYRLPVYELALQTAERAREMCVKCQVLIVTPEDEPLAVFGSGISDVMRSLLENRGIGLITSARPHVPDSRTVVPRPGARSIVVDRVIAMPELRGPAIHGLRLSAEGFIAVDEACRALGTSNVFAVGDAADYPVKHGGLAAQQADFVARAIAHSAGLAAAPPVLSARIEGMLLTGRAPLYLTATLIGKHGIRSEIDAQCPWPAGGKIAARHLGRYLAERDAAAVA